jgi:GT2 family glycosyltransferase
VRVTAVVLSVDEAHRLRSCLPAARAEGLDVLVVDDACTDDSAAVAAAHGAGVLALRERVSYAEAVQAGIDASEGDAVLLLNADCTVRPGFLVPLVAALDDPRVGVVAPRLLRAADGRLDAAGMVVDRRRRNRLVGHGERPDAFAAGPVFGADGACALLRRAALEDAGGLQPALELWASDAELMWRLRLAGWEARHVPEAVADHERFYKPSQPQPAHHRRLQYRNHLLMVRTCATWRDLPALLVWEAAALLAVLATARELLPAYRDAWRARRAVRRAAVRRARPPFGLEPPRTGRSR